MFWKKCCVNQHLHVRLELARGACADGDGHLSKGRSGGRARWGILLLSLSCKKLSQFHLYEAREHEGPMEAPCCQSIPQLNLPVCAGPEPASPAGGRFGPTRAWRRSPEPWQCLDALGHRVSS